MISTEGRAFAARAARWAAVATLAMTTAACNVTPKYERPKQDIPATYRNSLPDPSPEIPKPLSKWWTSFGSDELNALVEEALSNNRDVKAAAERIVQAEMQAGSAAAALLPTISASGSKSLNSPQSGKGTQDSPITQLNKHMTRTNSAYISASWELDLWGKIRASEAASLASALAAVHDREAVGLALVSDVVLSYLQYLEGLDRETVTRTNISNMKAMYEAVSERVRLGESSRLELAQQRNVLAQTEATVPAIILTRERAFNKLAILLGKPPQALKLKARTLRDLRVPEIAPGMPSDLLLRRPDVRKAEANLMSANANIGVARAKLFPTLSLSGDRGWASTYFDNITSPAGIFWSLAGTLSATIFDNGKNRADIAYYEARNRELIETYQQAILISLRDTEDAMAAVRLQNDLEVAQQEVLQASLDAYGLSAEAFRLGMVDYLNVLETQRTRFQAEDSKVQARYGRLEAMVGLYKALGGGLEFDGEQTAESAPAGKTEAKPDAAPPPASSPTQPPAPEAAPRPPVNTAPAPGPQAKAKPAPKAEPEVLSTSSGGALPQLPPPPVDLGPADIYKAAAFNDNAS